MRLVAWNCCMALHRKFDAMLRLRPGHRGHLRVRRAQAPDGFAGSIEPLAPMRYGSATTATRASRFRLQRLRGATRRSFLSHPAPRRAGSRHRPVECNLLAVWAQNGSGGVSRKHQLGPLRRALTKYRDFLAERPEHRCGRLQQQCLLASARAGASITPMLSPPWRGSDLASAYHAMRGELQGSETVPTLYWRDRKKDGPDLSHRLRLSAGPWLGRVRELSVGTFEDWCGSGLSDHVPIVVDVKPH